MTKKIWRDVRLCPSVLALACSAVSAQGGPATLNPVVVTATRSAVPLRDVLADVTVIERDQIERHAGNAVGDLLGGMPGFQMARSGGPMGTTSLFVRGGDQRFTAVLIDGVRVDTQTTGGASWEAIPLSQIERIEILRGPASAVYGSDAMSGVVQIFTRKGEPGTRLDVGMGGGSFGTTKSDVGVSGQWGTFDYALSGLSERSTGFNAKTNGNPDRDGYESRGGNARLGWNVVEGHRVEVSALRSHVESQYDGNLNVDDRSTRDLDTVRALWSAQWTKVWTSTISAGQSKDRYETQPLFPYLTETQVRTATWQNDVRLGNHMINATLEHREDELQNNGLDGASTRDRDQDAIALGYGWRSGIWAVQANARHDRNDDFGSVNTGTLAVGVDVAQGWRVQSSVGNGFRAPTLYQQYAAEFGNAGLKPERSLSNIDVALRHRAGRFDSSLTVYRNRITDLIVFAAADPALCSYSFGCYDNVDGTSVLKGATLTSAWNGDDVRVSGSVDFLSARNPAGRDLARRSRRHGSLKIEKDLGDTTA
ncbi:MAG TPA: TonB-dependent receptor, partial [Burkholderiaceae bacterium]|nr:TonB-dependent receptor [Burkholderiaceae bacterium]